LIRWCMWSTAGQLRPQLHSAIRMHAVLLAFNIHALRSDPPLPLFTNFTARKTLLITAAAKSTTALRSSLHAASGSWCVVGRTKGKVKIPLLFRSQLHSCKLAVANPNELCRRTQHHGAIKAGAAQHAGCQQGTGA
jgi:hypothetical protein